ncbi:MAG TPA: PhzF family phenazine biosynthesis protein [Sphingomonas sp.]|uniref:PhzF family phenazine biosynthesis protein n=1 Tax=Sphingomonas sp. TaxID=28214 RepID=UPI002ED8EBFB
MRISFFQVDAFASALFGGNPAAVMLLDAWLDDATLQAIAAENNLSETAFLVPSGDDGADYDLRWFTPTVEVMLCGHATLASGHVLLSRDPALDQVGFRTRHAGILTVTRGAGGYALALPAWAPAPRALPNMVAGLGVDPASVQATLWHPRGYGVVVLDGEAAILALRPDLRALGGLVGPDAAPGAEPDVLTIVTAPGDATDVVSRVFAPGAGIDEDPVTGSAHAVIAPYWADRLHRDTFTARQASARGGHLSCRVSGDRVILGGGCVAVIEGVFVLG